MGNEFSDDSSYFKTAKVTLCRWLNY